MSDDSPLTPEDRAMLDLARDADEPNASDRTRVRAALIAQLGVGVGLGTAVTGASTTASAAGSAAVATSFAGAKIIAVLAFVGAVGASVAVSYKASSPSSPSPNISRGAVASVTSGPVVSNTEPPPAPSPSLAPRDPPAVIASTGASPPLALPASSARTSSLEDETHLVGSGAAALRDGKAAAALVLLDEHARLYPHGILAEERAAERVLALCALGRGLDAKIDADRFLRDRPGSPLAARVRTSCAGNTSPP